MAASRPGNARGQRRRLEILQAAVRVVARGGAGALTHRAAAAEAGVSLASVTYHFPGIADLRRETLAHAADVVGAEFSGTLICPTSAIPDEGDPPGGPALSGAERRVDQGALAMALAEEWARIGVEHRAEFTALFALLVEALHTPELRTQVDDVLAAPTAMLTDAGCAPDLADGVMGALIGLALTALVRSAPGTAGEGEDPATGSPSSIEMVEDQTEAAVARFRNSAAVLFSRMGGEGGAWTR